jgi:ATP-dependent exoDNAse (exonuclease V) beta subunit
MYVGVTRSRDALIFAANQKKNLSWLENVIHGYNFENSYNTNSLETSYNVTLDLFNTSQVVKYTKVVQEDKTYETIPFEPIQYFQKEIPVIQDKAYILNPSKQKPVAQMEIVELAKLHDRLSFSAVETDQLGNTLHAMLYAKNKPYFERNATTLNANNGLGLDVSQFIKNTQQFEYYIQTQFHPIQQFPELHLEKKIGGKLAVGEADLVLELANELVLIDYKSFPGKKEDIFSTSSEFYAGKYSGQLKLYAEMLSVHSPKPVTRKLIYYVVQGVIVEIK